MKNLFYDFLNYHKSDFGATSVVEYVYNNDLPFSDLFTFNANVLYVAKQITVSWDPAVSATAQAYLTFYDKTNNPQIQHNSLLGFYNGAAARYIAQNAVLNNIAFSCVISTGIVASKVNFIGFRLSK